MLKSGRGPDGPGPPTGPRRTAKPQNRASSRGPASWGRQRGRRASPAGSASSSPAGSESAPRRGAGAACRREGQVSPPPPRGGGRPALASWRRRQRGFGAMAKSPAGAPPAGSTARAPMGRLRRRGVAAFFPVFAAACTPPESRPAPPTVGAATAGRRRRGPVDHSPAAHRDLLRRGPGALRIARPAAPNHLHQYWIRKCCQLWAWSPARQSP